MTGAYRDALLGQQVGEVGVMHALYHKAGQGDLRRAQQMDALACL